MDREQAVEIVLRGQVYLTCSVCERRMMEKKSPLGDKCAKCKGAGFVVNPTYADARRVLNLSAPMSAPEKALRLLAGARIKSTE